MQRCYNLSRNLSKDWNLFQVATFFIGCSTEILRDKLHEGCCAMTKKFVAALRQSLGKVELDCTSCNPNCFLFRLSLLCYRGIFQTGN